MIDWHSHLLPEIDDGSKSVEESLSILDVLTQQGVDTVIATPHFYANDESVESFLSRREKSFSKLLSERKTDTPKILLGAEVKYYQGISRLAELTKLCVDNKKILLLEMPMCKWTEYTIRELIELAGSSNVKIALAHIERYLKLQSKNVWDRLYENGILMQVNSTFFTEFSTKRKAISLLNDGLIHFVGSDCHNLTTRRPHMDKAYEIIEKRFGREFVNQMNEFGYDMLARN